MVTSQIALSLMGQNEKVCIASFEMKPQTTLARMSRMYSGTNPFSPEYQSESGIKALTDLYSEFGEWSDNKLWLYDQQGTVDAEKVIGMSRYCAKELGITHVIIDSLMKCSRGEDDYNGQKDFVDELTALARDNMIHIHLIHHMKNRQAVNIRYAESMTPKDQELSAILWITSLSFTVTKKSLTTLQQKGKCHLDKTRQMLS